MSQFSSSREQTFSKLFQSIAEKCHQGHQRTPDLIDPQGKAFLSSIGYTEQEFFAFIGDFIDIRGESLFWYRKAAETGDVSSQNGLGYLHANGFGVAQDYSEAAFWYRKAAEKGSDYAQLYLGYQYRHGQGVPQDNSQAIFWFRRAAEQGNIQARKELGI